MSRQKTDGLVLEDIVYRKIIKKQTADRIAQEVNLSTSYVNVVCRVYNYIKEQDWDHLIGMCKEASHTHENLVRRIQDQFEMDIPDAIWNQINTIVAEKNRANKEKTENSIQDSVQKTAPDQTDAALVNLFEQIKSLTEYVKTECETIKAIYQILGTDAVNRDDIKHLKEIVVAKSGDIIDAMNANFDSYMNSGLHSDIEGIKTTMKKNRY